MNNTDKEKVIKNLMLSIKESFIQKRENYFIGLIFLIFVLLRVVAWNNAQVVEDHDSIYYLTISKFIGSIDIKALSQIGPDATFLYPFFIAVFNLIGWFNEFGARLVTFTSSILLFYSLFRIGKRINGSGGTLIGLLILSFNPFFINFSVSILTEPLYLANIYFGIWYFFKYLEKPSALKAFLLGILFGLSFLNRPEGIVFLAFIPLMIIVKYFIFRTKEFLGISAVIKGVSIFALGFLLLSVPQVYLTSSKMGTFAINGRQTWQAIFNTPDHRSYDERLRGLDYSEKDINLKFLQSNPQAYKSLKSGKYIIDTIKNFVMEIDKLSSSQINKLVGIIVLITLGIGVLSLLLAKRNFELFFIVTFTIVTLIPPLMHSVDLIRHIAIIGPLFMLLSGIGISFLSTKVTDCIENEKMKSLSLKYLTFILLLVIPVSSAKPIYNSLKNSPVNKEYSPTDLSKAIEILRNSLDNKNEKITIISRKGYFTYYSGSQHVELPFTNYEKLVRYANLNKADYIYMQSNEIKNYPYELLFLENKAPDFELLYSTKDKNGQKIFLYKFLQ